MAKPIKESLEDRKKRLEAKASKSEVQKEKDQRKADKAKRETEKYVARLAKRGILYNPETKMYGVRVGGVTKIIDEQTYLDFYSE